MHFALEKIWGFCFAEKNPTKICVYRKIWYNIIQEMRKEKFPQYIRRIRRRVRSFLCFKPPLPLPTAGGFVFCCRRNPAYCIYKYKTRKEEKIMRKKLIAVMTAGAMMAMAGAPVQAAEGEKRKRKNDSCV